MIPEVKWRFKRISSFRLIRVYRFTPKGKFINCKLIRQGSLEEAKLLLSLTYFPLPTKVKIMPEVSNQRLNCYVGGHPYPIHRGEENKKGEKKKKKPLSVLLESEHTQKERLKCLHTACLPQSKQESDLPGIQHFPCLGESDTFIRRNWNPWGSNKQFGCGLLLFGT